MHGGLPHWAKVAVCTVFLRAGGRVQALECLDIPVTTDLWRDGQVSGQGNVWPQQPARKARYAAVPWFRKAALKLFPQICFYVKGMQFRKLDLIEPGSVEGQRLLVAMLENGVFLAVCYISETNGRFVVEFCIHCLGREDRPCNHRCGGVSYFQFWLIGKVEVPGGAGGPSGVGLGGVEPLGIPPITRCFLIL